MDSASAASREKCEITGNFFKLEYLTTHYIYKQDKQEAATHHTYSTLYVLLPWSIGIRVRAYNFRLGCRAVVRSGLGFFYLLAVGQPAASGKVDRLCAVEPVVEPPVIGLKHTTYRTYYIVHLTSWVLVSIGC